MKKFFAVLSVVLIGFLGVSICMGDAFDDQVTKAHQLKAKGDFVGAAEAHPRALCKAIYYWNAACKVVGHRDANGDWQINAKVSEADKAEGRHLLKLAQEQLTAANSKTGLVDGDDGTCTGVDPGSLMDLIGAVGDCIDGHCR